MFKLSHDDKTDTRAWTPTVVTVLQGQPISNLLILLYQYKINQANNQSLRPPVYRFKFKIMHNDCKGGS